MADVPPCLVHDFNNTLGRINGDLATMQARAYQEGLQSGLHRRLEESPAANALVSSLAELLGHHAKDPLAPEQYLEVCESIELPITGEDPTAPVWRSILLSILFGPEAESITQEVERQRSVVPFTDRRIGGNTCNECFCEGGHFPGCSQLG